MSGEMVEGRIGLPLFGAFSDDEGGAYIKPVGLVWFSVKRVADFHAITGNQPESVRVSANIVASAANVPMPDSIRTIGGMRHADVWRLPESWETSIQNLAPPDLTQEVAKLIVAIDEVAPYLDQKGRNRWLRAKDALARVAIAMGSDPKDFEFPNVRVSLSGSIYVQGFLPRLGFKGWQFEVGQMFYGDLDAIMRISDHPYLAQNGSSNDRPPRLDVFVGEGEVPPGMMSVPAAIDVLQAKRGQPQAVPGPILQVDRSISLTG